VGGDETQDELEMVNAKTRNLKQDNNDLNEITRKLVHQESMLERSQSTLEKEVEEFHNMLENQVVNVNKAMLKSTILNIKLLYLMGNCQSHNLS
jgi:N-acetylglutamate synthase-like GNAT family acetyltransferase